jgi:uncharacterized membrane protein HdeD (DUF308 family)
VHVSATANQSEELREATWGWWLALAIGVIAIAAGVIVIAKPSDSLRTLAVILGIFVLIDGIFALAGALVGHIENRGMTAVLGTISVVVGVLLIRHPVGGVRAIALLIGIWLIAAGVIRLVGAFERPEHRLWRIVVALVLAIVGVAIVAEPHIGYATLALITGIGFICYGVGMLGVGWALRYVRRHGEPSVGAGVTEPGSSAPA